MILFKICKPINKFRGAVWCGCVIGLILAGVLLPQLFAITKISLECAMLFGVFAVATEPLLRYLTMGLEKVQELWRRMKFRFGK